jgi:hypothetical protein
VSGVLRLALAYFSVVPLQRWISVLGAGLLLLSLVRAAMNSGGMVPALCGAMMVAMGPFMMGGGMQRHASSRTVMHLRPNGRLRMLLAATLAITLLAAVIVVPVVVAHAMPLEDAERVPFRDVAPFTMFAIGWTLAALMWAGTFITGASQLQGLLFTFLPLLLLKFGKALAVVLPSAPVVLAVGVVAWMAFALWYLHVRSLRRMPSMEDMSALHPDGKVSRFLQSRLESVRGAMSFAGVTNQYLLGSPAPGRSAVVYGFSWVAMACAILLLLVAFVLPTGGGGEAGVLVSQLIFLPIFMVTTAALGFSLTRRARLLWMRPGQDRAQLFARAERGGLAFTMPALGIAAVVFLAYSLLHWPERSTQILFFATAQVTFAFCLFYCGLSLTRGWAAFDVVLVGALCVFFVTEVILLRPWNEQQSGAAGLLGAMLLMVPVLRWHARRRWRAIDWRVARLLLARRSA